MEVAPGFKQTEVGIIPEEWQLRPLLTTVRIANGQVDPRLPPYKSMVLVAPDHVESGTGRLLTRQSASDQGAISGKYLFDSGDLVYSKIRPYLKKAVLADFAGLCSADMYPLKPADDVSGGFMLGVLLGHRFTKYAESVSVRSGMPKINRAEMADFVVALPPLAEQRAIAAALGDMDALLGGLDRLIAKKLDLKRAAMQQLLNGQTRLPGFHGEWEVRRVDELGVCFAGGTPSTTRSDYWGGEVFWLPSGRIHNNTLGAPSASEATITQRGLSESAAKLIKPLSVLVAITGATCGNVALLQFEAAANQSVVAIEPYRRADAHFIFYALLMERGQILSRQGGSAQGGVNLNAVKGIEIKCPGHDEQTAIATVLSDMDAELAALEVRRDKARDLKQAMMQQLLTGKMRLV